MTDPVLIQGGMGIGVSHWKLARAVSEAGQLGVVSGTALDAVFARRLQDGDPGGHMRRAAAQFPDRELGERVLGQYFIAGSKPESAAYKNLPMFSLHPARALLELTILANFCEVYLAKEGHSGMVGINLLEKIQLPTLPSLYGAMLAGVDYVLMGAGIPRAIPGILDRLSAHQAVSLRIFVQPGQNGQPANDNEMHFDPNEFVAGIQELKRPKFLAVVSSHVLASNLAKKASGKVDGFVVENHTAGGHNASPRGAMVLSERGEPVYDLRDDADLAAMIKLGVPFWLAGSFGTAAKLQEALRAGAAGIQVGTPFAFCDESGITAEIKDKVIKSVCAGQIGVFTDPVASACGYPFKMVEVPGSLSSKAVYDNRPRICDMGYLRTAYARKDGSIGFRCPGEPPADFVKKGGSIAETVGRKCLCNGLTATIGLPQVRESIAEPSLVTAGTGLLEIKNFLRPGAQTYSAKDVVSAILEPVAV